MNGTLIVNGESREVRVTGYRHGYGCRVLDAIDDSLLTLGYLERLTQLEHGANALPRIELHVDAPDDVIDALIADGWPVVDH